MHNNCHTPYIPNIPIPGVNVIDSLSSESTSDALSAKQGSILYDLIMNFSGKSTKVVDNLNSTNPEYALSARQGHILNTMIQNTQAAIPPRVNIIAGTGITVHGAYPYITITNTVQPVTIIDNVTSTSGSQALSANLGRVLNNKIDSQVSSLTNLINSSTSTKAANFTVGHGLNMDANRNITSYIQPYNPQAPTVTRIWTGSQTAYDAMTKETNVLYFIMN